MNGWSGELAQRIRRLAFCRLLAGRPVAVTDLAAQVAIPESLAAGAVAALVAARRAVTDEDGRVIGAAGLSLAETAHSLRIHGGAELWCWCAWDALGIASGLRVTAEVTTRCGHCGRELSVPVTEGRVPGHSAEHGYRPAPADRPLSCFCPYALLFCSAEHVRSWQMTLPTEISGESMPVPRYAAEARHGWSWAPDEARHG